MPAQSYTPHEPMQAGSTTLNCVPSVSSHPALYVRYTSGSPTCSGDGSCSNGKLIGFIVYETFSCLWTSQVIGDIALATVAGGPFGSWYYCEPNTPLPKNVTFPSLVRASTLSLGPIALGLLVVALLELLTNMSIHMAKVAASDVRCRAILCCCIECMVGCFQGLVEYFNRYAYIEIALYGDSYINSAKHTWRMFCARGIDVLVNDSLVGMTFIWGAYATGLLCSLFAYLYLRYTNPAYNVDGQYTAPVLLFAFLIGLTCLLTLSSAIEAGVSTIFVCIGNAPELISGRMPELYNMLKSDYSGIVQTLAM